MHASAARASRGGRERRVGLRKPVVVRRDRRTAYRHSGGLLDGPIGFPKAHPSLPPGERAVRVRTETLPELGLLWSRKSGRAGARRSVPLAPAVAAPLSDRDTTGSFEASRPSRQESPPATFRGKAGDPPPSYLARAAAPPPLTM